MANNNAKECLKTLDKLLHDKQTQSVVANNPTLATVVNNLQLTTDALKDTYSPNILRFMTKRDAYIKELVASAKNVMDEIMPKTIHAAASVSVNNTDKDFVSTLIANLTALEQANVAKQEKITAGKGDMVENTTHDIMKKHLQKNFQDIADMLKPLINALSHQL